MVTTLSVTLEESPVKQKSTHAGFVQTVEEDLVTVLAVGRKVGNRLIVGDEVFEL